MKKKPAKRVKAGRSKSTYQKRVALFVEAYLSNGENASKAAIAAGYSAKCSRSRGCKLLKMGDIRKLIEDRRTQAVAKAQEITDLTFAEVMNSLACDIRFDPANLFDAAGKPLHPTQMDPNTRKALRGIDMETETTVVGEKATTITRVVRVRFPEKTGAREQGMKHFGGYKADNSQKPPPVTIRPVGDRSFPKFKPYKARARAAA